MTATRQERPSRASHRPLLTFVVCRRDGSSTLDTGSFTTTVIANSGSPSDQKAKSTHCSRPTVSRLAGQYCQRSRRSKTRRTDASDEIRPQQTRLASSASRAITKVRGRPGTRFPSYASAFRANSTPLARPHLVGSSRLWQARTKVSFDFERLLVFVKRASFHSLVRTVDMTLARSPLRHLSISGRSQRQVRHWRPADNPPTRNKQFDCGQYFRVSSPVESFRSTEI